MDAIGRIIPPTQRGGKMNLFVTEIAAFHAAREAARSDALQNAALFLMCGIDLEDALGSTPEEKRRIMLRMERMIERERLKGRSRHWSYDLNRHIALKQALDRLRISAGYGAEAAEVAATHDPATKALPCRRNRQPQEKRCRSSAVAGRNRSPGKRLS
jgi:hypothetical protein